MGSINKLLKALHETTFRFPMQYTRVKDAIENGVTEPIKGDMLCYIYTIWAAGKLHEKGVPFVIKTYISPDDYFLHSCIEANSRTYETRPLPSTEGLVSKSYLIKPEDDLTQKLKEIFYIGG